MGCKLLAGKGWFNLDSSLGSRNSWTGIADRSESCLLAIVVNSLICFLIQLLCLVVSLFFQFSS
jgi:hypothetical protein